MNSAIILALTVYGIAFAIAMLVAIGAWSSSAGASAGVRAPRL